MSKKPQELCMGCMQKKAKSPICPYCGYDDSRPADLDYVLPGTLLGDDRYIIGRLLHSNGEGATYIGYDNKKNQIVWIKEYFPTQIATRNNTTAEIEAKKGHGAQYKALMSDFVELANDIKKYANNQPIIKVLDTAGENNTIYIIQEYIEALTLDEYLTANGGKLASEKALELLVPLFNCVDNIHANGIIHRGISPYTVLVDSSEKVYLSEFILTAARTGSSELKAELFSGYSAPEQYISTGRQGTWSDVYALAALLYRTVSGITPTKSIRISKDNPLAQLSELDSGISNQLSDAVHDAMNTSVEKRTQTVGVLLSNIYIETNGDKTEIFDSGRLTVAIPELEEFAGIEPLQPTSGFQADFQQDFNNATISQAVPDMKDYNNNEDFDFSYQLDEEYDDGSENKSSHKAKRIITPLLILLALALVVGVLMAVFISGKLGLGKNNDRPTVSEPLTELPVLENDPIVEQEELETAVDEVQTVPDLVGKEWTKVEHNKDYTDFFELEFKEEYSEDIPEGVVIEQKPRAGRRIPLDSTIIVTVSQGYIEAEMPNLVGMEEEEAKQELLKMIEAMETDSEDEVEVIIKQVYYEEGEVEIGQIFLTSPEAGTKFNPYDTKIELQVAKEVQTSTSSKPPTTTAKPSTGTSTGRRPSTTTGGGTTTPRPGGVDGDDPNVNNLPRA